MLVLPPLLELDKEGTDGLNKGTAEEINKKRLICLRDVYKFAAPNRIVSPTKE